ncbi:hypothetical protein B0E54_02540 [Micromonospora sp. MH99]|nr:hypothetical protein [Micromonospora sp. MH99]
MSAAGAPCPPCPTGPAAPATAGSSVSTGARCAPLASAHRTTVPSAYVWTTSKVSRSACGSGPIDRASWAGPDVPAPTRTQVTAVVTVLTPEEWMPVTGLSSVRELILGAQPSTDIG